MWLSLLEGTIHPATKLSLYTRAVIPGVGGSSCRTPLVQPWVGEAWHVVGELSRAGGLVGTKPWPGCLGAGSRGIPETPEVVKDAGSDF